MPTSRCLIVSDGFHPLSSERIERQIVPLGYTFGWKSTGVNLHFGGLLGYSSEKAISILNMPPSQIVCRAPTSPQSALE